MAHTPGPWIFYADTPSVQPEWHVVTSADRMRVIANIHIEPGNASDLANARLIAAAPSLLAACRAMLTEMQVREGEQGTHPAANLARAAIAKAEAGNSK